MYVKCVKFVVDVDFGEFVLCMLGFVGVDFVNVVNEVVLYVVEFGKLVIGMVDFDEVIDCVLMGFECKSCVMNE